MSAKKRGRPRKFSDDAIRRIVEWRPLKDLCRELGINPRAADWIRNKYRVFQ